MEAPEPDLEAAGSGLGGCFFVFYLMAGFAAFVGGGVFDQAVDLAAFVVFREVLRDGKPFGSDEEEAVAVFVLFHFIAGADPFPAAFEFRLFVGVKIAGAERTAEFVHVSGKAVDDRLCDATVRVARGAGFFPCISGRKSTFASGFFRKVGPWYVRLSHSRPLR